MHFYELIEKCDLELVVNEFLSLCDKTPDVKSMEQAIRNVILNLREREPVISDTGILYAEKVEDEEYSAVSLVDKTENEVYGIEAECWAKTIGYIVDEESLCVYGNEKFAALVLWEMTWFGYDEDVIRDVIQSNYAMHKGEDYGIKRGIKTIKREHRHESKRIL